MTSKSMSVVGQLNQALLNNYYQKSSCLRPYLLGYGTKTNLKTGQNCLKFASSRSKPRQYVQKRPDLGIKSSQSRLFTGASSYELNSLKHVQV